jgi:hypothetical protein
MGGLEEFMLPLQGQHEKVAQIFRLADKYGLRNLDEVPEDSLQMVTR